MNRLVSTRLKIIGFACCSLLPLAMPAAHADDASFKIVVSGGGTNDKARLKDFRNALKKEVKPQSLSDAYIECKNCDALDGNAEVTTLELYVLQERPEDLQKVARAWQVAYGNSKVATFSMTVNAVLPPDPACPYPPEKGCNPRPFCASMGGCSENAYPLACKKCDGVPGLKEACGDAVQKAPK